MHTMDDVIIATKKSFLIRTLIETHSINFFRCRRDRVYIFTQSQTKVLMCDAKIRRVCVLGDDGVDVYKYNFVSNLNEIELKSINTWFLLTLSLIK